MKKLFVTIGVFSLLVFLTQCKKDDNNPIDGIPKIKKYTYLNPNLASDTISVTYGYDDQGRLTTITQVETALPGLSAITSLTYSDNTVTESDASGATYVFTLDNRGYAIYYAATNSSDTTRFTYDADGHWISADRDTLHTSFTWLDGNLITATNDPSGLITYTYFSDKTNTIGNANRGITFYGKDSKNLISRSVTASGSIRNYSYEYDSQNRVTKVNGTVNGIVTYTYY